MSTSFSDTELGISQHAHLESAFMFKGWNGEIAVEFKWELQFQHAGANHWVRQNLSISRDQADALHKVLGHMLGADVTNIKEASLASDERVRHFVRNGELAAEYEQQEESVG
jgi:predicted Zn-dependent protease